MSAFTDWEKELEAADMRTKAAALRLAGGYPDEAKYYVTEAQTAIEAADQIMFSEAAIERAADEVLNHWRQTSTGRCECGQFASKDPQQIAQHLTRAVVAALREET